MEINRAVTVSLSEGRITFGELTFFGALNDPMSDLVFSTALDLNRIQENLHRQTLDLAEALTREATRLASGLAPNTYGIVQDAGRQIDRLCAEMQQQADTLSALLRVATQASA